MKRTRDVPRKWRTIQIEQELAAAAARTIEKRHYSNLSQFIAEAIQSRLEELKQHHEKTATKHAEYPLIRERLLYTPKHVWAMVTPKGNICVGLSSYAQEQLKGIVAIQTYPVGYRVMKDEPFGVIETWMFTFDLYSPVSGKIIKINTDLQNEPAIINKDPYEITWIAELNPINLITLEEEQRGLMRLAQYRMWVHNHCKPRILGI